MKVCVFGAGAIGGYMAAELARAGDAEVTCIARGPHLAAMIFSRKSFSAPAARVLCCGGLYWCTKTDKRHRPREWPVQ